MTLDHIKRWAYAVFHLRYVYELEQREARAQWTANSYMLAHARVKDDYHKHMYRNKVKQADGTPLTGN